MIILKNNKYSILSISLIVVSLIIITVVIFYFWDKEVTITDKFDRFGSFLSGTAGLIVSLVGTVLVYLTYQTQKEELQEARKEAQASREALQEQAETGKQQQITTQLQQFENTFFNLLANHREVTQSLSEQWHVEESDAVTTIQGKTVISYCVMLFKLLLGGYDAIDDYVDLETRPANTNIYFKKRQLNFFYNKIYKDRKYDSNRAKVEDISWLYREIIFETNKSSLAHYFRNLYHLILFVDEYKNFDNLFTIEEVNELKYKYVRLVRAQLSNDELILLALNSISDYGQKFKRLIEKYYLLDNADILEELECMEGLEEKYPHFALKKKDEVI